jgi:DsbC/DsbD-like thiol-disulfide interchange protein
MPWPATAADTALETPWQKDHASRVRLIAGGSMRAGGGSMVLAAIELELDDGWKTYWRNPGSSGVPPHLDWTASGNVADVTLLFPAPIRFRDREGDTIGYKSQVVLPLLITPKVAAEPIDLKLSMDYGVCKDVCIPVQSTLALRVPSIAASQPVPSEIAAALSHVPKAENARPGDPRLVSVQVALDGAAPAITLIVHAPAAKDDLDVFLEAPEGQWIPFVKRQGTSANGDTTFIVDLADGAEIPDLKGKMIRATLVAKSGQSEAMFRLE